MVRLTMGLTPQEALDLFNSDDLLGIGMAANEVRRQKTDPRIATYQIDRNINYTNFCTEYCSFCAFYRPLGAKDGYILPLETIYQKIQEMIEMGGTGVLLQGGLHPDLKIEFYENMLRSIRERFPQVHLHCFSAPEITCIAEVSGLSLHDTISRLRDAGLVSIPGGGAEILDDEVRRRISRLKCGSDEWEAVHRTAHALGMRTTATMMFGCGEEMRHRVNHLERLRRIQQDTGGFTAFIPWIFAPENTPLGKENSGNDCVRLPEDASDQPALSRQYRPRPIELAYAGNQDLPGRIAIWGGRCGQHSDRRKRGLRGGCPQSHQRRRTSPHHHRRRLHPRATRYTLSLLHPQAELERSKTAFRQLPDGPRNYHFPVERMRSARMPIKSRHRKYRKHQNQAIAWFFLPLAVFYPHKCLRSSWMKNQ